jgi:hypothetical protein
MIQATPRDRLKVLVVQWQDLGLRGSKRLSMDLFKTRRLKWIPRIDYIMKNKPWLI